jgi:hypothetical protein
MSGASKTSGLDLTEALVAFLLVWTFEPGQCERIRVCPLADISSADSERLGDEFGCALKQCPGTTRRNVRKRTDVARSFALLVHYG